MGQGCRSSGLITTDQVVFAGRCKLVSIHGANFALSGSGPAAERIVLKLYDNATAASGKIVGQMIINSSDTAGGAIGASLEFDMHSVICHNGLYADVDIPSGSVGTAGLLSGFTVEFA
tara:strand:- start:145 stop:498 length:354 start_codon:yes stop_codon:yes gene_type:complete